MSKELEDIYNEELNYCIDNEGYFVDTYGHIENKDTAEVIVPFQMWKAQRETLQKFHDCRRVIVLKARQLGFTWLALHHVAWVLLKPTKTAIGLSETEEKAKELVRRLDQVIFRYMPELIAKKGYIPKGWTGLWYETTALTLTVHHPNGNDSVFECFPSSPNAGRSFTADVLLMDEWAFQQFDRDIWAAIYPTINRPNSGQVIGISSIKRGSLFEELYTNESNSFEKIFIPWYADPHRDDEWYKETQANLADPVLMTAEYPATVEEALTVPGGAFFPEVKDESFNSNEKLKGPLVTYFSMDYGLDMLAGYWYNRDAYGNTQIVREECHPDMTIGAAADMILSITRELRERGLIGPVQQFLAPPDLWNRSQESGKSRAILFQEAGLVLTKVNNDIAAGCAAMKEMLIHTDGAKGKITALNGCAPTLLRCLKKIQRDEDRPNIYANKPHNLTHSPDGLRYYCIYWTNPAVADENKHRTRWRPDMWEDYENANEEDRQMLIERWGEPDDES